MNYYVFTTIKEIYRPYHSDVYDSLVKEYKKYGTLYKVFLLLSGNASMNTKDMI